MISSSIGIIDCYRPDVVTDGLQLYLNAGDPESYSGSGITWTDISPNGYSATINSATYSSTNGGSILFDGTGEYVNTNQSLSSEEFTIGAWFKTSASGIKMIISKETEAGWPWNYRIWMNGGTIVGDIAKSAGTSTSVSSPSSTYNNGNWHQVFFTRNDSTLRLYVNGVEVANATDTLTGSIINSQEVWIGLSDYTGGAGAGNYQFYGNIGEVMIYNRDLVSTEIKQNYDATKRRYGV